MGKIKLKLEIDGTYGGEVEALYQKWVERQRNPCTFWVGDM